jgi:tRNA dimethylallyltransferase
MSMNIKPKILIVLGPTASGKSDFAVTLAKKFDGEIISADSRQIYKSLDIGSNKITSQEKQDIKHYLLDIANPDQKITLHDWQKLTFATIEKILQKKKLPIIVGGTGLYLSSILENYQLPDAADCPYDYLIFGLKKDTEKLYQKINHRVDQMIDQNLVAEVKNIYQKHPDKHLSALSGIGYQEIIKYLDQELSLEEATDLIKKNTRNYAKRQMTWFRRMERRDFKIHWNKNTSEANTLIKKFLD